MKLVHVLLRDKIPSIGSTALAAGEHYDLSFEGGFVTVVRKARDEEPFLVPVSNVIAMRPEKAAPKK